MGHDAFVSFCTQNTPVAEKVRAALEGHGIRCWIAPRDIAPGTDWSEAIIDGLTGSRLLVLVLSAASN